MIYKLEDLEKNIKSQLRDLNWDAQRESFEREPRYDQIENKVNLKIEDNVITYNLGEYIFDYPRDTVSDELEEGEGSVFGAFSRYFQIIEKIIARADSIQGRLEHYIKFEQRLLSMLSENLQGVEKAQKKQKVDEPLSAFNINFNYS
jgi:hypothetical protein